MKTRQGFVSNSSSSSFVIVSKERNREKTIRQITDEVFSFQNPSCDHSAMSREMAEAYFETGIDEYETVEALDYQWKRDFGEIHFENRAEDEDYRVFKKLIEKGFVVRTGAMPNGGDGGTQLQRLLSISTIYVIKEDFAMVQQVDDIYTKIEFLADNVFNWKEGLWKRQLENS